MDLLFFELAKFKERVASIRYFFMEYFDVTRNLFRTKKKLTVNLDMTALAAFEFIVERVVNETRAFYGGIDDLDTIKKMLARADEGYDIICGCRYIRGGLRLGGSMVKGFFSSFVGWTLHYLLWIPTHDVANAFKMYRKKVIDNIDIRAEGFDISMEITLKGYYAGFKIAEVPTVWRERTRGKSNFKMLKLFPNYFKLYLWGILKALNR